MDYTSRSPILAGLLSLLMPGLGHMYAGEAKRGFIIFIVALVANPFALSMAFLPYQPLNILFMALIFLIIYLFAIINSVRIAQSCKDVYVLKKYNKWYLYIGIFLLNAFVINPVVGGSIKLLFVQAYKIPATSMEPTLLVGDHIMVNKFIYRNGEPERGDIIVFEYPPDPSKDFVKRVAGVAGDVLETRNNTVVVNGKEQACKYAKPDSASKIGNRDFGPITVPENSLFVLGDNIDHSYDSRFWGFVKSDKVKGKVVCVYWSWDSADIAVRWDRIGKQIK